MISNLVLSILTALFTIVAVTNSIASSRYARQAKASAERAAAAANRAEEARKPIADHRNEQPPGPTHLTYEQLLPIAAAIQRRETAMRAGAGLCPPFPGCPTCGQVPAEFLVRNDHPDQFLHDQVAFGFRPCGHTFTADAHDLYRATEQP